MEVKECVFVELLFWPFVAAADCKDVISQIKQVAKRIECQWNVRLEVESGGRRKEWEKKRFFTSRVKIVLSYDCTLWVTRHQKVVVELETDWLIALSLFGRWNLVFPAVLTITFDTLSLKKMAGQPTRQAYVWERKKRRKKTHITANHSDDV